MPDIREKLSHVSTQPGVYLFKNSRGKIIYIGKAKVLRNRVRSYFQKSRNPDPKTVRMMQGVRDFETIITDTEVEALILESNLIKEYKPRYNINLKDDKSYPYIRITHEAFPRIFPTRKLVQDGSRYFGPYTDVQGMRNLLKTIQRLFPIRSCKLSLTRQTIAKGRYNVCLNYHINRCSGPCEGFISQAEYNKTIQYIIEFINGNTHAIEQDITEHMQHLAEQRRFEQAARMRDQLLDIQMFTRKQKVFDPELPDRDVIAAASNDDDTCCVIFRIRQGKILSKSHYFLENTRDETPESIFEAFIKQFYLKTTDIPGEIIIPAKLEDHKAVETWLSHRVPVPVRIQVPEKNDTRERLLGLCERNAKYHLNELEIQKLQKKTHVAGAVKALQKALILDDPPKRIEGFDISNIQGTDPTASMVCFVNGKPSKSDYRRFKIRSKQTPDDFTMMHEAVKRRYSRIQRENKDMPDLILIDGGKGQLNAAVKALNELGIRKQPIIALAKRLDEVFMPNTQDAQNIPKDSAALRLLQRVRDESHRFAVTFHRSLRSKRALSSELDDIPGVGPTRRQLLLRQFKSVDNIKAAGLKELKNVDGISESIAETIYNHLNSGEGE
ncbi:MAG: excinuclease ABC subunit UvrC [candidate division KSB1 bacterium]|nr:excinuclease ABC subunit UvrC [candidate division KSB1 bacterium]